MNGNDGGPGPWAGAPDPTTSEIGPASPAAPAAASPPAAAPQPATAPPGWYPVPGGGTAWWDGTAWWQGAVPTPAAPYRTVAPLAAVVQGLLAVAVLVRLAMLWADLQRYQLVGRVIDRPGSVTFQELTDADGRAGAAAIAFIGALLVTGVVLLVWRHRVQRNLDGALRVRGLEYTPGWSVGWWFVPFANLVKPKQAMNEAWQASDPTSAPGELSWRATKAPALLSWWWAAWLVGAVLTRVATSMATDSDPETYQAAMAWSMVGSAVIAVAGVLCLLVVRGITERHVARAVRLGVAHPGGA